MTCPQCGYYWCWVCGLPVKHWIHTFAENPFGCMYAPKTYKAVFFKFLIYLLGLILIPAGLILLPILGALFYGLYGGFAFCFMSLCCCGHQRINPCLRIFMIVMCLPTFAICVGVCLALGTLASGIGAILILPALTVHSYLYFRSVYWWSKNKAHTSQQK